MTDLATMRAIEFITNPVVTLSIIYAWVCTILFSYYFGGEGHD